MQDIVDLCALLHVCHVRITLCITDWTSKNISELHFRSICLAVLKFDYDMLVIFNAISTILKNFDERLRSKWKIVIT